MNNRSNKDIITALSTPYGRSALAVIRVSGDGCIELVNKFLKRPLENGRLKTNVFYAGDVTEKLTAVCFRAPKSYTGDDMAELMPHGNPVIIDAIIKTLIDGGARAAERGEFTERAFSSGKLDLMQCEALADIIDAQTTEQLDYGNKRYNGGFDKLDIVEKMLERALSTVEAVIHYGDELEDGEIDEAVMTDVYSAIDKAILLLEEEANGFVGGRIINDGFKVALIGMPNVGKSTLLNALVGSERAIVTDIEGTTRDTVDGSYIYKDRKFVIIDTAGIRTATDKAELIGIDRAIKAAEEADAVIELIDERDEKLELADAVRKKTITVKNKCDAVKDIGESFSHGERHGALEISAKHGVNMTALKEKLYSLCPKAAGGICNHRQFGCVTRCLAACKQAKQESEKADGLEIVAAALYDAYSAIEELYGEKADENVIAKVFERFCVGK